MSLKSASLIGHVQDFIYKNDTCPVVNIYLTIQGGKKYGNIKARIDAFGPIAKKAGAEITKGDMIAIEGTLRQPIMHEGEPINYLNADKIHYLRTAKTNEVYQPQQLPIGELA